MSIASIGRRIGWRLGAAIGAGLALLVLVAGAGPSTALWLSAPWSAPTPTSAATATATLTLTSTATPTPAGTPTPISTAGWKTFVNTTYGYSIMYPPEASIYSVELDRVNIGLHEDTGLHIWRHDNPSRLTAREWVEKMLADNAAAAEKGGAPRIYLYEKGTLDIGGNAAYKMIQWVADGNKERIYLAREDNVFELSTYLNLGIPRSDAPHQHLDYPLYKKMMETFTFIPLPPTPTPTFTPTPTVTPTPTLSST